MKKITILFLSICLTGCSFNDTLATSLDIFETFKTINITANQNSARSSAYFPTFISNVKDIPNKYILSSNDYSFDINTYYKGDYSYYTILRQVPIVGVLPTISNIYSDEGQTLYYNGSQIYVFNVWRELSEIVTINDDCLNYSSIFKKDDKYYLFDVGKSDGIYITLDLNFKVIDKKELKVNGFNPDNVPIISFSDKSFETRDSDMVNFMIANQIFHFDNESLTLTTDGFTPLNESDFNSQIKAIKCENETLSYSSNYQYGTEYESKNYSFYDYNDHTISIFISNDNTAHIFINIGYENKSYHYFTEYLRIDEDISHFYFKSDSFYIGTSSYNEKSYSEIYQSNMTDCYNKKEYSTFLYHQEKI